VKKNLFVLIAALTLGISGGCGRGSAPEGGAGASSPAARAGNVSLNKADYPVFPDADAGADPSVSAEQGGKGFTGQGWESNTNFDLIGDPHAVKGGVFRETASDFPSTVRPRGPNTNIFNQILGNMVYETLMGMHPTTLEYIPALASHWQISADKSTYRFRIDPNARWADGMPVIADDVVASWTFWMDKGIGDPALPVMFGKFEKPVAESKYIVRVKALKPNWRNFMYFSNLLLIMPAHVVKNLNGAAYARDYNYKMVPGSGPYAIDEKDVEKGVTIHVRRRPNYWAEKSRRNVGAYNFDDFQIVVVRDRNLEFEMFKKGELDYYYVNIARMWEEELNFAEVGRGLVLKRRIWNHHPRSIQGMIFNTRRAPYDDIRVRKALRLLFNREQIVARLMYGAYSPINSGFPGTMWENPDNEKITYDPQQALKLLAEAGYSGRDAQGRLTRNGTPLALELIYPQKDSERFLTVFQEDLRKVGITLNLRLVTYETMIKLVDEHQFGLVSAGLTSDVFPNPESWMLSSIADPKNTLNISGFKNARVDELIAQYDVAYTIPERVKIIQEIDKLFTDSHHWICEWYPQYERITFWNKFGMPKGHFTRIGDYMDMYSLWWNDPAKSQRLDQARRDTSINLGQGEVEDKYWLEFARTEQR